VVGVPGRALTPPAGRSGTFMHCSCMKDSLLVPDLAGHSGAGAQLAPVEVFSALFIDMARAVAAQGRQLTTCRRWTG